MKNNYEDEVCSYGLSIKLKELKVKQDSFTYWIKNPYCTHMKLNEDGTVFEDENGCAIVDRVDYEIELGSPLAWNIPKKDTYSAFTVGELIKALPSSFLYESKDGVASSENVYLRIVKYINEYQVDYFDHDDKWFSWSIQFDKYLPNALAKMLIHLLENGLIKNE